MFLHQIMTDTELLRAMRHVDAVHVRIIRDRLAYRVDQITQARAILDGGDVDLQNRIAYAMHTLSRNPY